MADPFANDPIVTQPQASPVSTGSSTATNDPFANDPVTITSNTQIPAPSTTPTFNASGGKTPVEAHIDNTLTGRILDTFESGWKTFETNLVDVGTPKAIYGEEPFGLSDQTVQGLRQIGVFNDYTKGQNDVIKAFNESLIRPAAAALDYGQRTLTALTSTGPAKLLQAAGEVTGLLEPGVGESGEKFYRDTKLLLDSAGIVLGSEGAYMGVRPDTEMAARYVAKEPPMPAGGPYSASVATSSPRMALGVDMAASKYVDKAGNINLKNILAPDDVKQVIVDQAQEHAPEYYGNGGVLTTPIPNTPASQLEAIGATNLTRTPTSFDEIARLANDSGISMQTLLDRNVGDAWNSEQIYAARNLLVQSAADTQSLAKKAVGGSDEDISAFLQAVDKHAMIQGQVAGLTAEAGRALAQFRMVAQTSGGPELKAILEDPYLRGDASALAKSIANLDTPQQVSSTIANARNFSTLDKIQQIWMAGLLSNPVTHQANILGNTVTALWRLSEKQTAGVVDTARVAFGGSKTDRTFLGEAAAGLYGLVQGIPEGIRAAGRALVNDVPENGSKFETSLPPGGAIGGIPGRLVNGLGPTELVAEDQFFKTIARRSSLHSQAYAEAARLGLKGSAFFGKMADLVTNPTEQMLEKAEQEAEYVTFTKKLGKTGRAWQATVASHSWMKFIFPFNRTPVNLLKFPLERTPLSVFSQTLRDDLLGRNGQKAQTEQFSKVAIGSSILFTGYHLASQGLITGGGPTDPKQRDLWMAQGNRPYSIRSGENYYSYARFEPIATMLGTMADAYEISHLVTDTDAKGIGALIAKSASNNLLSKTFLIGLSNTLNAMTGSDPGAGEKWLKSMVGSFIPSAEAQYTRMDDPYLRDARTMVDYLRTRVSPALSKEVQPQVDVFGNDILRDKMLGGLSPVYVSAMNNDPILRDMLTVGSYPAPLKRQIRGVDLTPEMYHEYQAVAGKYARQRLEAMYSNGAIYQLPNGIRKEMIDKVFSGEKGTPRDMAKSYMIIKHPEILTQASVNRQLEIQKKFQ